MVLLATHVLLLRIDDAQTGEWSGAPDGFLVRSARLTMTLLEILKGTLHKRPGDQFHLRVTQYSSGSPRRPVAPGVWSGQALDPGAELLAFCHDNDDRVLESLLAEGSCQQIMPADGALGDVRLALRAESERLSSSALLDVARSEGSGLGYMFVEYLLAKVLEPALSDEALFDALMQTIETPALSLIARWMLLKAVYSAVANAPAAPPEQVHRLALMLFRVLEVCTDASVTDNIVRVFLPNLLGLQGGLAVRNADDVFHGLPEERSKVKEILDRYRGNASTAALLDWLEAKKDQP